MNITDVLIFLKPILFIVTLAVIAGYAFAEIIIAYFPGGIEIWLKITSSFFIFVLILTVPLLIPDKIKEKFRRKKSDDILGPGKKDIKGKKNLKGG